MKPPWMTVQSPLYHRFNYLFRQGVFFALFLFVLTTYLISEKAGDLYSSRRRAGALAEETKSETAGDGSSEPRKSEEWQPTYCDILMTASVEIHRELMMELYIYAGIDLWYLWCQSWRSACWNLLSWTSKQTFGPLRAIARPGARQQLDYWGGCTMQAMGWISAGFTRWYRPMVFRYFHHCIHFW